MEDAPGTVVIPDVVTRQEKVGYNFVAELVQAGEKDLRKSCSPVGPHQVDLVDFRHSHLSDEGKLASVRDRNVWTPAHRLHQHQRSSHHPIALLGLHRSADGPIVLCPPGPREQRAESVSPWYQTLELRLFRCPTGFF